MQPDREHMLRKGEIRLYREAERCKRLFNDASSVEMEIHRDGEEGAAQTAQITRQEYAQACEPLLEKIRQPVKRSLCGCAAEAFGY